jgi:hypothetical protein
VRNVVPTLEPAVQDLCERFIETQAFGAVVPEGQEVRMAALTWTIQTSTTGTCRSA